MIRTGRMDSRVGNQLHHGGCDGDGSLTEGEEDIAGSDDCAKDGTNGPRANGADRDINVNRWYLSG